MVTLKFTAVQAYLEKQEESQSNLIPKGTRKRTKPCKVSRKRKTIKTGAELNAIEVGDLTLPDFKLSYKAIVIKIV